MPMDERKGEGDKEKKSERLVRKRKVLYRALETAWQWIRESLKAVHSTGKVPGKSLFCTKIRLETEG